MVFSSSLFLFAFFPAVLLAYYLLDQRFKNVFLLIVSLFFYAWGEPRFVFVMIGSILMNHIFALLIDRQLSQAEKLSLEEGETEAFQSIALRRRSKALLTLMVTLNLLLFFVFKYLNFTLLNLNVALAHTGVRLLPQTSIPLPIGISFFTFQAMSYVFDVYYRKGQVQKNPLNTALYVSFFPQLVAGPIVRYQTVADEIRERKETLEDFVLGIRRFVIGLSKKVILSNTLAVAADAAFSACSTQTLTTGFGWLGALAYSMQLYFDFSGYSDMAIGMGLMFGFHFSENFNHSFTAKSNTDFWRRQHISLSLWFRDYVYIPLGGSRVSRSRWVFNMFVVWILTGIWHGANWTFMVWGMMFFVLLVFEKFADIERKIDGKLAASICYRVFTLTCIAFTMVAFRSENIGQLGSYFKAMLGFAPYGLWNGTAQWMWKQYSVILLVSALCCLDWGKLVQQLMSTGWIPIKRRSAFCMGIQTVLLLILAVVSISFTVASTYNPFIYFNF